VRAEILLNDSQIIRKLAALSQKGGNKERFKSLTAKHDHRMIPKKIDKDGKYKYQHYT